MSTTQAAHIFDVRRPRSWWGWVLSLLAASVLLVGALLPPFVGEELRHALMAVYSGVCHQISARSPSISGVQLAVCHRCIGIYGALAAAPLVFLVLRRWDPIINRSARWLIVAAIVIPGTDWLGDVLGLWTNTIFSRAATGAVFGLVAGYFLCRALVELLGGRDAASHHTEVSEPGGAATYSIAEVTDAR